MCIVYGVSDLVKYRIMSCSFTTMKDSPELASRILKVVDLAALPGQLLQNHDYDM